MPMYWDAYIADTTHLSCEEHGAYLMLLGAMWRRDGTVPDDDADNARILGLSKAKWRKVRARLSHLLIIEDGLITQKNLRKIWENTQEKIAKNRVNGAKGGRAAPKDNNDLAKANASNSVKRKATISEPEPESDKIDTSVSTKKPPSSKPKRACQIPDGWVPNDKNIEDATNRNFSQQEIDHEANQFRDYHLAKGTTYKDWNAGWRTWLGNARKFARPNGNNGASRPGSGTAQAFAATAIKLQREQDGGGNDIADSELPF